MISVFFIVEKHHYACVAGLGGTKRGSVEIGDLVAEAALDYFQSALITYYQRF